MTDTGGTTQLPGVTFVGVKPTLGSGGPDDDTGTTPDNREVADEGTGGVGGVTQAEVDAEVQRLNTCAADKFDREVTAKPKANKVEHFSVTFERNGQVLVSETREATGRSGDLPVGSGVTGPEFAQLLQDSGGVPFSDITGFNHSHPAEIYCNASGLQGFEQQRVNQRPSGPDWAFADTITNSDPNHPLVLYVRDCGGAVRAFPYSQKASFLDGSRPTPPPIQPEGCEGSPP